MASIGFIIVTAHSRKDKRFSPAIVRIDDINESQDARGCSLSQTKDSRINTIVFLDQKDEKIPCDMPKELVFLKKMSGGQISIAVLETVEQVYQKLANAALGIVDNYVMPEVGENTYKETVE